MDPRLRAVVDASVGWYDDVFAAHGIPVARDEDLWWAEAPPPRWHSAVKTLEPGVPVDVVLAATERHEHGTVADSFGGLDLAAYGFDLLIDATWLHRRPEPGSPGTLPAGWLVVSDAGVLATWNDHHDTADVLVPGLLTHPRFRFLARHDGDLLTGGFVLHDAGAVVGLSNGWSLPGDPLRWPDVLAATAAVHPGRPIIDYAWGEDLDEALAAGFVPLGPQRVWIR